VSVIKILKNRNFIFILAFALGFLIGDSAGTWIEHLAIPALAIVMVASLVQFPFKNFLNFRSLIKPALYSILVCYFVFGAIILLLAKLLIKDNQLWIGFVLLACAPPGVAVPPFTKILAGDEKFSIIGMVSTYIAIMAILPLAGIIFIGSNFVQPLKLIILFIEVIIGPMIVSQILIRLKWDKYIARHRGTIVNWGLFVIIFVVIALNRNLFFKDLKILGIISLISFISILGLWLLLNLILKKLKFKSSIRKSLVLFGTVKNGPFAAAVALSLFSEKASVPGAIFSVFLIIYLITLSFTARKNE
jgi:BASS family bile acid:Na+ symporter